jgi:hypothetical protein
MSSKLKIVAPSLVTVTSYIDNQNSLHEMSRGGALNAYPYVVHHHLVQARRTKGALDNIRNSLGRKDCVSH